MHQGVLRFESGVRQSTLADEQYILNWIATQPLDARCIFEIASRRFQRQQPPHRLQRQIQALPEREDCPISIRVSWMP